MVVVSWQLQVRIIVFDLAENRERAYYWTDTGSNRIRRETMRLSSTTYAYYVCVK